jgi:uncharacterized protein (TIGR03437 family)
LIVSGFGSGLAAAVAVASSSPLPTDLGETTVEIVDSAGASHLAPLFAVAPTQINYLVPAETALGQASVTVKSGGSIVGQDTLDVAAISPGLYSANYTGSGVAAAFALVISGASRTQTLVFDPNTAGAVPIDLGGPQDEVYLLLFGTGIRGFRNQVTAAVGGNAVPVLGAVPQGEFPGLDQVNIGPLPKSLAGKGSVDVILTVDGTGTNPLTVSIR